MMKQVLVTGLASCLFATSAYAQSANFEGFAAAVGANINAAKSSQTNNYPSDNGNGDSNIIGVLDLSYAKALNSNFLVGIGATVDLGNTKTGYQYWGPYRYDSQLKNSYALYVKPTYALNNSTALYAKLSYNFAKSDITDTDEIIAAGQYSNKVRGVGYGVGAQISLTKNIFANVEINRIDYKTINFTAADTEVVTYKPQTTNGVVSVGYRF